MVGLLRRRPVEGLPPLRYIGKEGSKLDDRLSELVVAADGYRTEYTDPKNGVWERLVVPVLDTVPHSKRAHDVHLCGRDRVPCRGGAQWLAPR